MKHQYIDAGPQAKEIDPTKEHRCVCMHRGMNTNQWLCVCGDWHKTECVDHK